MTRTEEMREGGSGVGLAVLFRVNRHPKENLGLLGFVYAVGAGTGILIQML